MALRSWIAVTELPAGDYIEDQTTLPPNRFSFRAASLERDVVK